MVNRAKSDILKAQLERKQKDALMAQAVALFHAKLLNPDTGKPMSMQKLCQLVSDDYYETTHKRILADDTTLARLVKGGLVIESPVRSGYLHLGRSNRTLTG